MSKKKMEKALQVYVNDAFGKIRGMMIDGKPYFVGKDVAEALGYKGKATANAIKNHVFEQDKLGHQINDSGQRRTMILINESGLYKLIFSSTLPSAEKFTYWVTSEVLPSIRETGAYVVDKKYKKWLETRQQTIETRKLETSAIKLFIEYARSQGFTGKDSEIYSRITILANLTAGLPLKKARDNASISQLSIVAISENAYKQLIIKGVTDGLHYTRILAQLEDWRTRFIDSAFIQSYIDR